MRHERDERVTKRVTYQYECDGCGKKVAVKPGDLAPAGWTSFDKSHGDWGNDSVDSWDHLDVCSHACYLTVVRKEFEDYGNPGPHPTLSVDGKDWAFLNDMLNGGKSA